MHVVCICLLQAVPSTPPLSPSANARLQIPPSATLSCPTVPDTYPHHQTSSSTHQMEIHANSVPFWDISQTPIALSQIADDDFLTLLQRQFPTDVQTPFDLTFPGYNNPTVIDPQSQSDYTLPVSHPTPSFSDSGSSPIPTTNDKENRSLKRKASDENMNVDPAPKTDSLRIHIPEALRPWLAEMQSREESIRKVIVNEYRQKMEDQRKRANEEADVLRARIAEMQAKLEEGQYGSSGKASAA